MAGVRRHEDLICWQLSDELEDRAYEIIDRPAAKVDRRFCEDISAAGRSAPNNLAEGFHRYRPRDAAKFVRIAIGSLGEMINHLRHAKKRKYITAAEHAEWTVIAKRARGAANRWREYLESCPADGPWRKETRPDRRSEAHVRDTSGNAEPEPEPEPERENPEEPDPEP